MSIQETVQSSLSPTKRHAVAKTVEISVEAGALDALVSLLSGSSAPFALKDSAGTLLASNVSVKDGAAGPRSTRRPSPTARNGSPSPGGRETFRLILLDADLRPTAQKRAAESHAAGQLAEIEAIYRTAPVGLCFLDRDLRFVRINERLAEMNGFPAAEHVGRTIREMVPGKADAAEPIMRQILQTGELVAGIELTGETPAQPGVRRAWIETWAPLRAGDGEILGINVMAEEVTGRNQAEKLRKAFAGLISHELRTPVTTIYGAAKLLSRAGDNTDAAALLFDIEAEADRLNQIIEDMLVLSRAEHGALDLPAEPMLLSHELGEVVKRVCRRFPQVTISTDVPSALPPVAADRTALHQIVTNLLTNAAKYAGGDITLKATKAGEFVEVSVDDCGPGFEAGEGHKLFELFYRGQRAADAAGGTGIGLFVVKALVEAMGGTIAALAIEPRGASFRFTLPVAKE